MQTWTAPLWCVLIILSLTLGQDEQPNDSLRTAIEAVSRRQRDLAASRPSYYVSGGLSQYRYSDRDAVPEDELSFLGTSRDFTGDGQPENIGYGYQKTIASPPGIFPPSDPLDSEQLHSGNSKGMKKILMDYLQDEIKAGPEKGAGYEDEGYYHKRGSLDPKRSLFRERVVEDHTAGNLEAMTKLGDEFQTSEPTAFRERVHDKIVDDVKERKLKLLRGALARKMEEEEEERRDREKGRINGDNSEEYLGLLRSVWDKYSKNNPDISDIEDISEGDVGEILNYLGNSGFLGDEDVEETRKRSYDGGYDFLTHNAAMGGWGVDGHQFKKRWNQRLDGDENQKGNFLYSLKFVSPAANREAIESLKDDDGLDLLDERDQDILLLPVGHNRREFDPLFQAFEHETPEELFSNPGDEDYQRLGMNLQSDRHTGLSRKDIASLTRPNFSVREMSPITEVFPTPEKKYLYDTAIMKKRYPVTKRSSEFYASPPLLHHKKFAFVDTSETRKKKDTIVTTDPKVARELNQIFSSPAASDHSHAEAHPKGNTHDKENSDMTATDTDHVGTTYAPLVSNITTVPEVNQNATSHHSYQHRSGSNENAVEQPVTASRAEAPLEIKKKSIKWSDYFGIDRRRKKAGPNDSVNESHATSKDDPIDDEWLLNQYHKTYAMSTKPDKKRSTMHLHEHMQSKKAVLEQPFDTRVFDTDIFARNAQRDVSKKSSQLEYSEQSEETQIDNMDAKLHNVEDAIVNEALKYTGAHEGTTDTKEIQEVKDKVLAHLATAYSLEKMRQALRELKSHLLAEKMSRYNIGNKHFGSRDEKKKRVAVKKEKAEEKDEDKKKRDDGQAEESFKDMEEFLVSANTGQVLPEGDIGSHLVKNDNDKECPVLEEILNTCRRGSENVIGDHNQLFVPLCSLHQICYLCGPELGVPSSAACDLMFINEAYLMCLGDADCQLAARRNTEFVKRSQIHEEECQCCKNPCIAQYFLQTPLLVPIPVTSSR